MSLPLARQAARLFALDPETVTPVAMRENLTYSAMAGDKKFALRLHRPGYASLSAIRSELAFMAALANTDFAVPNPKPSSTHQLVEDMDGQLVSVLSWVEGIPLSATLDDPTCEIPTLFYTLGQTLARMHLAADAWTPPENFTRHSWNLNGLLGELPHWGRFWDNVHLSSEDQNTLRRLRDELQTRLSAAAPDLDYGLIHADAVGENVLIQDGKTVLIDFDDSGWGYRLFDLATPLNKMRTRPEYSDIEAALLDGYRSCRPIDTTHIDLIRLLRALTYLGWIIPRIHEPEGQQRLIRFRDTVFALM